MGPLGSFIQLRAGRRWNWGRRGSEASLEGADAAKAGARPDEIAAAAVAEVERNLRRLIFMVLHAPLREVGVLSGNHTLRGWGWGVLNGTGNGELNLYHRSSVDKSSSKVMP